MKLFAAFAFLLIFVACGSSDIDGLTNDEKSLNIACAANMQFAMDSIAVLFESEYGIKCEITSGSSGMLTSQIENGAPYDIFVSANMNYPETIYSNGHGEKPIVYATGRLIFVTTKDKPYQSLEEALEDENLERIGIADYQVAPYGMAANQFLNESGNQKNMQGRLVIGESIGQINSYMTTGAIDGAFTSYSFKVKNKENYTYFEVDPAFFDPINQGAMVLNHGLENNLEESELLVNFFSTEKCKDVLKYFGYLAD